MRRSRRLPLEQLAPYLMDDVLAFRVPVEPEAANQQAPHLDWPAVFGNDRPVECEVGFGKGLFLLTEAARRPEVNFLGVEIERKYQLLAATRLAKRGLTNVRLACADARLLFRDRVAAGSLAAVHVFFPDPWWKTRHRKRRLFTAEFAAEVARVLRPGGLLHLVTDVEEYFGVMKGLLAEQPRLRERPPPETKAPEHDLDYLTHFERKYRKEGRPIWRAAYEAG